MVSRLQDQLVQLRPDIVVVSGDLTQRARVNEFAEARAFLDAIPSPQIVIPGNHDIELYDLYGRFVERLQRYKRYISEDVEPFYSDAGLVVASINTARSLTFKGGRISMGQVNRVRENLRTAPPEAVKILVAHHPLDLPHALNHALVGRARMALRAFAESGLDLILSGHLHLSHFCSPTERLRIGGHSSLLVQAGTAVSTRSRGELNSFNVIEASNSNITVRQRCWSALEDDFTDCRVENYENTPTGWRYAM
jgi:3',5'-cyclic AMP phosphodiesterase CpdA